MKSRIATTAVAASLLASLPAGAQDGMTEDDVRSFFDEMTAVSAEAAATGNWQAASDWMQSHIAGGGSFTLEGVVLITGGPTFSYAATLDSGDLERLASLTTAGPVGAVTKAVENYSITADVQHVQMLPNGEATAAVGFREAASIDPAQLRQVAQGGAAEQQAAEAAGAEAIAVQSSARCEFRLREGDEGVVQIRLGACETTTTF